MHDSNLNKVERKLLQKLPHSIRKKKKHTTGATTTKKATQTKKKKGLEREGVSDRLGKN